MAEMDKALEMLSDMLSSEEGQKNLENMLDVFTGGGKKEESSDFDPQKLMAIASLFGQMGKDDERAALLYALKPYLSEKRGKNVEAAVKLLSFSKLPKLLKEIQ